jgi:autotransporter-associated beta strand protein
MTGGSILTSNGSGAQASINNIANTASALADLQDGIIATTGDSSQGLYAVTSGLGSARVTMAGGAITTSGSNSHGLRSRVSNVTSTGTSTAIMSGGSINSIGTQAHGLLAENEGSGEAVATISGGSIEVLGTSSRGIVAQTNRFSSTAIARATMEDGSILTSGNFSGGIFANQRALGTYAVALNGGTITTTGQLAYGVHTVAKAGGTINIAAGAVIDSSGSGVALRDGDNSTDNNNDGFDDVNDLDLNGFRDDDNDGNSFLDVAAGGDNATSALPFVNPRDGIDEAENVTSHALVTTAGTISGDAILGLGNDVFNLVGGSFTGNISGDDVVGQALDGNDTFNWTGGNLDGGFYGRGGSDIAVVTGSANFDGTQIFDGGDDASISDGWNDTLTFVGHTAMLADGALRNWETINLVASDLAISTLAADTVNVTGGYLTLNGSNMLNNVVLNGATLNIGDERATGLANIVMGNASLAAGASGMALANNVQITGANIFNVGAGTMALSGVVSGSGQFIKTGAGTFTITGANSYAGGTLVSAGRLTGDTTSLQGAIVNNAQVEFAQSADGAYAGILSGTGALVKTGAGTLTLTGANTYTGGTLVSAGRLTGNTETLQGALVNNAQVEFAQSADGTYADSMSGTGALVKTCAGALTLTGANSYTGGTLVQAGRLTGNTTSLQGDIVNDAQVEFAQGSYGIYAGNMSGSGALMITGAGRIDLTGLNSYSGGTLLSAGYLHGDTRSLQGAIVNNTMVEFAQNTDGSYAGLMSGTGALIKTGAGTLTLTGANSYTGGTLVSAGRLTGDTTSLQGAIVNNALVEFAQSADGAYAGILSGTGALVKTGAGTLTLTGANSYTGGTFVSAGRLTGDTTSLQGAIVNDALVEFAQGSYGTYAGNMSGSGALMITGAGRIDLTGLNSYTGGTLLSAGYLHGDTRSLQGAIANNALVEFAQSADGSYTGAMSGTGALIKTGAGTLTLTGANSYAGGTLVSAGRLTGDTRTIQGALVNNALVEFAQSADGAYAGILSGTGALVKTGAGTLTLTGANTYTGGTLVSAGRLTGNTTSLQGSIINDAQVEFAQSAAGTYADRISGTGSLIKTGAGMLTLSGVTSISGQANVAAGTLNVMGALATSGITVQSGAILSGKGVIGGNMSFANGAVISPGDSPGTLSVIGNVSFSASSNFIADIDGRTYSPAGGAGSHDLLAVSGSVTLGGTLTPVLRGITGAATNSFTPSVGDSFVVVSAAAVTGTFASVTQPVSGLSAATRFDAIYGEDYVRLVVTPESFGATASGQNWSSNGDSAASALDGIRLDAGSRTGPLQTLFNGFYGLDAAQLQTAFSQVSGAIYANSLQAVTETERATFSSIFGASCDASCGLPESDTYSKKSLWGRYVSNSTNHNDDHLSSGYNSFSKGLNIGATLIDSGTMRFGVAASYVENTVTTSLAASSKSDSTAGYMYLHYTPTDEIRFSSVFGVSLSNTEVARGVDTTKGHVAAQSERQSLTVMYGAKVSYRGFVDGPLSLWTDAGIELSNTSLGRIQETAVNQDFALSLDKVSRQSAETQLASRLQLSSNKAQISVSAGAVYALGDHPSTMRNVGLGGANWTVRSVDSERLGIRLAMQSRAQLSRYVSLSATYQRTNQGKGYTYDRANVGLSVAF